MSTSVHYINKLQMLIANHESTFVFYLTIGLLVCLLHHAALSKRIGFTTTK